MVASKSLIKNSEKDELDRIRAFRPGSFPWPYITTIFKMVWLTPLSTPVPGDVVEATDAMGICSIARWGILSMPKLPAESVITRTSPTPRDITLGSLSWLQTKLRSEMCLYIIVPEWKRPLLLRKFLELFAVGRIRIRPRITGPQNRIDREICTWHIPLF